MVLINKCFKLRTTWRSWYFSFLWLIWCSVILVKMAIAVVADPCADFGTKDTSVKEFHKDAHYQLCVGFSCPKNTIKNANSGSGLRSIGAYDNMENPEAQSSFLSGTMEVRPDEKSETGEPGLYGIEIYPLVYNTKVLFGWFHIRLTILEESDSGTAKNDTFNKNIIWFVHQTQTNSTRSKHGRNHVFGEYYVGDFHNDCASFGKTDGGEVRLSRENILPCLTAQNPSLTMSYAFGYNGKRRTPLVGFASVDFNWKMNFAPCPVFTSNTGLGEDVGILFRAFVQGNESMPTANGTHESDWTRGKVASTRAIGFAQYVYGGHDPVPPPNAMLKCSVSCATSTPPWVENCSGNRELFWASEDSQNLHKLSPTCTAMIEEKLKDGGGGGSLNQSHFYGRCDLHKGQTPTGAMHYSCPFTSPYYKSLRGHDEYVDLVRAMANSTGGFVGVSPFHILRKGHAVVMAIVTFLLMPLGNYISRYCKESFLIYRWMQIHVWHQVHTQLYIFTLLTTIAGVLAGRCARSLAFNLDVVTLLHYCIGMFSVLLFVVLTISGSFRLRKTDSALNVSIIVHALGGYVCWLLFLGNSILSLFMPTSAVSFNNGGSRDGMASSVLKWLLTGLMILSYLFVLTMNLESSYFIWRKDKFRALEGVRTWLLYIFPLPTVSFDDDDDPPGTKGKMKRGIAFITVLTIFAFCIAGVICW